MNKLLRCGLALLLATASINAALAQVTTRSVIAEATTDAPSPNVQNQHLHRGSKIIGAHLRNLQNNRIGEIKDILLDSGRGEVAYVVVSFRGNAAGYHKYHAIPWRALQPSDDGKYYILQADQATISQAPGFDRNKWPNLADQRWSMDVDRYWNRMTGQRASSNNSLTSGTSGAVSSGQGNGAASSK